MDSKLLAQVQSKKHHCKTCLFTHVLLNLYLGPFTWRAFETDSSRTFSAAQLKSVVWIGDVNINQNSLNCTDYKKLDITMKSFGMIQTVSGITRIGDTKGRITQSTIDVVITNCYSKFTGVQGAR